MKFCEKHQHSYASMRCPLCRKEWRIQNNNKIKYCSIHILNYSVEECPSCKKEYNQKYWQENKDQLVEHNNKYYQENKDQIKENVKEYQQENREKIANRHNKYYKANKDQISKRHNKYDKKRKLDDPAYRLRKRISTSIYQVLKINGSSKEGRSILQYLPYTIKELKSHIESQFEPWMNWNNQGIYDIETWDDNNQETWTWQLDHIIPHSTFKYTSMDSQEFRDCWMLSNLRPYSAKQNQLDGANKVRH